MDSSAYFLAAAYWLHLLSTVLWLGALSTMALLVLPAARAALDAASYAALLGKLRPRLQALGWFCLVLLSATGMFQMSASPAYEGFMAITNPWSVAILAKHLAVAGMVVVSGIETWAVYPALQRAALLQAAGKNIPAEQQASLRQREVRLLRVNVVMAALVLLLTALARAAV